MAFPGEFHVRLVPSPEMRAILSSDPLWRLFGERIRARAVELCPVGKNDELGADYGKPHSGDHLKDSIEARFIIGTDPRIEIGSKQTVDGGLSKLALILLGTSAHDIDPVRATSLVFTSGGQVVFAGHVDHPGTKKNPFIQEAMKQICREAGAAAVTT